MICWWWDLRGGWGCNGVMSLKYHSFLWKIQLEIILTNVPWKPHSISPVSSTSSKQKSKQIILQCELSGDSLRQLLQFVRSRHYAIHGHGDDNDIESTIRGQSWATIRRVGKVWRGREHIRFRGEPNGDWNRSRRRFGLWWWLIWFHRIC